MTKAAAWFQSTTRLAVLVLPWLLAVEARGG